MTRKLYLDCTAGISGDMAVGALLDLGGPEERAQREQLVRTALASLPVDGFDVVVSRVSKSGIDVCDFDVVLDDAHENHDHDMDYLHGGGAAAHGRAHGDAHADGHAHDHCHDHGHDHDHEHVHGHGHEHEHRNLADVEALIDAAQMSDGAREVAKAVFGIVAAAEAQVHGKPVDQVHFHEVGAVDSIADIVAFAVAFDHVGVRDVVVTELWDGKGTVRCQHGIIPIPVPAVASIVRAHGIPVRIVDVQGELVTPTGAAIAAAVRTGGQLPERFTILEVGAGAGKRAYPTAGFLRAMIID